MSAAGDIRNTRRWKELRASVLQAAAERQQPCAVCHEPIDYTLSGRDKRGPSLDHHVALVDGGRPLDPQNLRPVHAGCNTRAENQRRQRLTLNTSRRW